MHHKSWLFKNIAWLWNPWSMLPLTEVPLQELKITPLWPPYPCQLRRPLRRPPRPLRKDPSPLLGREEVSETWSKSTHAVRLRIWMTKNFSLLIQLSSCSRDLWEPKTRIIFEFLWVLFEIIHFHLLVYYIPLILSKIIRWHFHCTSKEDICPQKITHRQYRPKKIPPRVFCFGFLWIHRRSGTLN